MAVKELNATELLNEVKSSPLTIVDAYADWCGPCQMMKPIMEELSNAYNVVAIDVDSNQQWAGEMNINSIPCILIYKDGKMVESVVGYQPKEAIESRIKDLERIYTC